MIVVCAAQSGYTWDSTEVPDERYVIIGNGFDKACNLPTGYSDFLSKVKMVISTSTWLKKREKTSKLYNVWKEGCGGQTEAYLKLINNAWYRLFQYVDKSNDWVDFEKEISNIVTSIEANIKKGEQAETENLRLWYGSNLAKKLKIMLPEYRSKAKLSGDFRLYCEYKITYQKLRERLMEDFKSLRDALWYYLKFYSELKRPKETKSVTEIIDAIKQCDSSFVVSFNYTNTLEQILEGRTPNNCAKVKFCYIHGELGRNVESHTMVLGIEDHPRAVGPLFLDLRKDHQRDGKEANSDCQTWTDSLKSENRHRELIIFGHSLSEMDRDIISGFMEVEGIRIKVYYYDEEARVKMQRELDCYGLDAKYTNSIKWKKSE